jgi:hypothetical protein
MIRLKLVRVFQSGSFGPIRVYKRPRPPTRRIPAIPRTTIMSNEKDDDRRQELPRQASAG